MNSELDAFVTAELSARRASCRQLLTHRYPASYRPDRYSDLEARIASGEIVFLDWLSGHPAHVWRYGTDLVQTCLDAQGLVEQGPQADFAHAARVNFNPHGSHFDCLVIRLIRSSAHAVISASGQPGSSRTIGPPAPTNRIVVRPVIYNLQAQHDIISTLFRAYASYHATLAERFPAAVATYYLSSCWDMFRGDAGDWLPLFRAPEMQREDEWLVTAMRPDSAHP